MLAILLGPKQFDAANYVRQKVEDVTGSLVGDDALASYAELANEEFSRFIPLDGMVGDPVALTSPLKTVANQQRYILSPANGFASPPMLVNAVSYYALGAGMNDQLTVQNEWAFLQMNYGTPRLNVQEAIDSPTQRVIRDANLDELRRYNRGYFAFVQDRATGLPAIDLYPIPTYPNLPVCVRYQSEHLLVTDALGDLGVATIPSTKARDWAKLLLLEVFEQEADRMMKQKSLKAGLIEIQSDTRTMEQKIERIREEVNSSLGMHVGTAAVAN